MGDGYQKRPQEKTPSGESVFLKIDGIDAS
jgi:hypothetical protein